MGAKKLKNLFLYSDLKEIKNSKEKILKILESEEKVKKAALIIQKLIKK